VILARDGEAGWGKKEMACASNRKRKKVVAGISSHGMVNDKGGTPKELDQRESDHQSVQRRGVQTKTRSRRKKRSGWLSATAA